MKSRLNELCVVALACCAILSPPVSAQPLQGIQAVPGSSDEFAEFVYATYGFKSEEKFRAPSSLAVDQGNNLVYVCDPDDKMVYAFSLQGTSKFKIGEKCELDDPVAVAVDRIGNLYVSERSLRKVKVFDTSNKLSAIIDLGSVEEGTKPRPGRLAVTRDGDVLVVDEANQQILVFDKDREFKFKFGKVGDSFGEFRSIGDVAADRQGRIYVVDSAGIPIQVFDKRGKYISRIGIRSGEEGGFTNPAALMVDRFDQLWTVDSPEHNIKISNRIGLLLRVFGEYGMVEQSLFYPVDVDIDSLGRIYILERGARRMQVFQLENPYQPLTRR